MSNEIEVDEKSIIVKLLIFMLAFLVAVMLFVELFIWTYSSWQYDCVSTHVTDELICVEYIKDDKICWTEKSISFALGDELIIAKNNLPCKIDYTRIMGVVYWKLVLEEKNE